MSYYGYYPHGPYPGYHAQPGQNWTPAPPSSAPPSTGAAVQFGAFQSSQMEQHGYTAPLAMFNPAAAAGFNPYAMPLMAPPQAFPGYPPMPQLPPPPSGTHPRKNEPKPRASAQQRGETPPTKEEQGLDATTPPTQSVPPTMMHPYAQMTYYPPYPYPPPYMMAPTVDHQSEAAQRGFKTRGQNNRIQSAANAKTRGNASMQGGGQAQDRNEQRSPRSATTVPKKRLQFVNPETLAPVETSPAEMSTPIPPGLAANTSNTSTPNTASCIQEDVSKLVSEVMASTKDKTPTGKITSKVKMTELDTPKSTKTTMKRTPVQTTTLKKIIDPSNGAYHPGPFNSGPVQSGPQQRTQFRGDQNKGIAESSFRDKVLNTVASIERGVKEDRSKKTGKKQGEVYTPPQEKEANEKAIVPHQKLILDNKKTIAAKKTEPQDQGVKVERQAKSIKIVVGSKVNAPKSQPRLDLDSPYLKQELFKNELDSPYLKQDVFKKEQESLEPKLDVSVEEQESTESKQEISKEEQDASGEGKESPKAKQDVSKQEQDLSDSKHGDFIEEELDSTKAKQDTPKQEQEILKKDQEVLVKEQDVSKEEQDVSKEEQDILTQEQEVSITELQDSASVESAANLMEKLQSLPAIKTSCPVSPSSKNTTSTGTQTAANTPTSEDRVSITKGTQTYPQSPTSEDLISITVGTQTLIKAPCQDPMPPPLTKESSDLTDTSFESPMTKSQPPPRHSGSGKQLFNRQGSDQISKENPTDIFHDSSGNRKYSFQFLKSFKDQHQDKPNFIETVQCLRDFEGSRMTRSGSERWLRQQSSGRGGFEERSTRSLSRNYSGRSGSGSLTNRGRLSRSLSGQKGDEGAKWGKSDISNFTQGSNLSNIILHKSENKYVIGAYQTDDPEEEKRQKTFKGLLNKLTPDNFEKMFEKFKEVEISDAKTLRGLIDQIFDKALIETTFCPLYSELCKLLSIAVPEFEEEGDHRKITFRRLLLNKCQAEYEKGDAAARAEKEASKEVKNEDQNEVKNEDSTIAEGHLEKLALAKKERMRSLGNMQFIGYLFQKGMLTEKIIHNCIRELLREDENPKPEDIECLSKLITTVGKLLPNDKNLDAYFIRIERLSKNQKLETRHRFMLVDLIELRARQWVERREKEGPKTIEEIHRNAMAEQQAQNARNRVNYTPERRDSTRGRSPWGRSPKTRQNTAFNHPQEEVRPLTRNLSLGRTPSTDISLRPSSMMTLTRPKSPTSPCKTPPVQEQPPQSRGPPLEGEALDKKVKALLDEYYNVKDLEEALQCIKELSENNVMKPEILKSVLLQSLDIRTVEVDQRLTPIIPIITEILSRKLFIPQEVKQGLKLTMIALPDIAEDFPKAPGLIGRMFGALVSTGVVPLRPLLDPQTGIILSAGKEENSEEDSPLIDAGFGNDILIAMLKEMKKNEDRTNNKTVKEALEKENANLSLFYPAYLRGEVDLEKDLQFLNS